MSHRRVGSILTLAALSIVGCDPQEPEYEAPPKIEISAPGTLGPPSPPPAVMPSPTPSLPSTLKSEREAADKAAESQKMEPPK